MEYFFNKVGFRNDNDYVEFVNLSLITILSSLLYLSHGISFFLYAYSDFLIITQIISFFVCIAAFFANRIFSPRISAIIMIALICSSINIWALSVDIGNDMRWYVILAICPLYFFSIFKLRDKIIFTIFIMIAFLSSSLITNYCEPLAKMPNASLYNTITSVVVFTSFVLEVILYQYVNTKRDNELKRIETILNNIECGIVIVNAETHELFDMNLVAERIYGCSKDDIVKEKKYELVYPIQTSIQADTDFSLDEFQTPIRTERQIVRIDGATVPIISSVSKIWYNGQPALLESFGDISELKKAEEKLRLMEITERANIAKSEFLSRMSHEMRTPMNAIIGMTQIADESEDLERIKYCLSNIGVSSNHLLGIINDILDMSKIESGKFALDNVPFYIEDLLVKIYNLVMEPIEKKNIRLDIYLRENARMHYIGDDLRLSQVIANLMSNAVKFTQKNGSIQLEVEAVESGNDYSVLQFTVTDTGIGMTEEQMKHLFNAFEQADGSITRQFGGTGLGLAISKNIVDLMGGELSVKSEQGKGSVFSFELRLEFAEQKIDDKFPEKNCAQGTKILIVDGDVATRKYLKSITEGYGMQVDEVDSVQLLETCIKQIRETGSTYKAVFLAYNWPETNGIKVAESLANSMNDTNIVLMTSFLTWSRIESEARQVGIDQFITKPLFPSDVVEAVCVSEQILNADAASDNEKTTPDFSEVTLLLVEDIEINREIFITLLDDTNVKICIAENGEEAVSKFVDEPDKYDIIVMDIQMPIMNGYEATKQIRAIGTNKAKTIPIIAMSADAFQEDIDKCLACGMNGHLKKPIELERVIKTLSFYSNKQ